MSCCRDCLGVFVGVVGVAGRALQPFLPFPKQILSSFAICPSTRLPILFFSSRRLAQKLLAFFVRKKKEANFANFAYPISACDFLPCNWDLSCFNFDLLNTKKKKQELRASCTIACSLFIAFRCFTLETGTIAFSLFGLPLDCQHHTARDGTTRGPKKKKTNSQGVDPRTSPKRA